MMVYVTARELQVYFRTTAGTAAVTKRTGINAKDLTNTAVMIGSSSGNQPDKTGGVGRSLSDGLTTVLCVADQPRKWVIRTNST